MRTVELGFAVVVAACLTASASACGRDDLPTGAAVRSPSLSIVRTPQSFTVGPLGLGGIGFAFPGGNLHFRDALLSGPVSGDIAGTATILLNADLDALGNGPTWGTMTITSGSDTWQGNMTGHFQGDLPTGILLSSQVVLHGPDGQLLRAECDEIPPSNSETLACSGEVQNPGT